MTTPALSVVVPSVNGWSDLQDCLRALEREHADVPLEVIVPERVGTAVRSRLQAEFPRARVIDVDPLTTIPEMRARSFDAATAPSVAVIEDHVIVPAGWARQMIAAIGSGDRVIGGSIENGATGTLLDWAAFLCEYSHCLPPLPAGQVETDPLGSDVSVRRIGEVGGDEILGVLLDDLRAVWEREA